MAEISKVIRALECHATKGFVACQDCPYYPDELIYEDDDDTEGTICEEKLAADAIALLKGQEPRVMAEGDVLHSTGKPIWFESRGMYLSKKGFWILPFEVDPELHIRFVQSVTGGKITFSLIDYGKVWRCWTARPTEEQMRKTPWEGEEDHEA